MVFGCPIFRFPLYLVVIMSPLTLCNEWGHSLSQCELKLLFRSGQWLHERDLYSEAKECERKHSLILRSRRKLSPMKKKKNAKNCDCISPSIWT